MKIQLLKRERLIGLALIVVCLSVAGFAKSPKVTASTEQVTSAPAPAPVATPAAAPSTPTTETTKPAEKEKPKNNIIKILCPEAISLIKEELIWKAPGGWRSYSQSFVREIKGFVGAQWVGVEVGKMLCIYTGIEKVTFPVVLQNDQLVPQPKSNSWGTLKVGYVNCKSGVLEDCHFTYKKEETNMENIYEALDFFKGKKDPLKEDRP